MSKQPTATAFTRSQESWAEHMLAKTDAQIVEREAYLINEKGWAKADLDNDDALVLLYEEAIFWERYGVEMGKQREYIRGRYLDE